MKLIKPQDKFILVSNEEFKEGDTCYNIAHQVIVKPTDVEWANSNSDNLKKVISESPDLSLLKEEDCKEIGWVDVEKLWLHFNRNYNNDTPMGKSQFLRAYEYITAKSLNDKKFTKRDMYIFGEYVWKYSQNTHPVFDNPRGDDGVDEILEPKTEWDVEVNENNQITKIL